MCNYIFTYLSTVIFLLVKLIWRYRRDLRDYCTQFYNQPEQGSMYYRLKAYAKYLQMCVTVACEGKGREQNCFIIEAM